MKQEENGTNELNGIIPAISAVFLAIFSVIFSYLEVIPTIQSELLCNFIMIAIALRGLLLVLRFTKGKNVPLSCISGNMAVPIMAVLMNINVFGHVIRLEYLLSDLWSWHSFWIVCAVLQLLLLSPLGRTLLTWLKEFLGWLKELFGWGKDILSSMGGFISETAKLIRGIDKKALLIIVVGIIIWAIYLCIRIRDEGMQTVFSDMDFWGGSLLYWTAYVLIAILICMIPTFLKKTWQGIQQIEDTQIMAVMAVIVLFALSMYILPFLLGAVGVIVTTIISLTAAIKRAAERDDRQDEEQDDSETSIRMKDLVITLLLFVVIPLGTIFLLTACIFTGEQSLSESIDSITSLMDFFNSVIDVANNLLQVIGIG